MSDDTERSAPMLGSQPVAWAVFGDGYEYVSLTPEMCGAWATENGGRTVPLYATPAASSTPREGTSQGMCTLTADEREVVASIAQSLKRLKVWPVLPGRTQEQDVDLLFRIAGID